MPLLWLSLAFLCGLPLAALTGAPAFAWLVPAGLLLALALLERRRPLPILRAAQSRLGAPVSLLLVLAALLGGAGRMALERGPVTTADLAYYNDRGPALLTGRVVSSVDRRDRSTLVRVRVEQIMPEQGALAKVDGVAMLQLPAGTTLAYGQAVELRGEPLTPPEDESFSYREYLAQRGIHTLLRWPALHVLGPAPGGFWPALHRLREGAYRLVLDQYPQPESALMAGILLGLERDLPEALERAYHDTGTAHIIAISGFNLSILAALFIKGFGRVLPLGPASLAAGLAIGLYSLLVGANPAVVRAAVMAGLGLGGALIGRRGAGLNSLALSAAVMSLGNPYLPWDVSFQLSFGATLGLILYGERFEQACQRWCLAHLPAGAAARASGWIGDYLLLTLAAQITTLPVTAYHFQRLSLSMLAANPLVLPPQPLVMVLGVAALLSGGLWPPLGQALAALVWPAAAYSNRVVSLLAQLPAGSLALGEVSLGLVAGYYALLLGLPRLTALRPVLKTVLRPAVAVSALGLLVAFTWRGVLAAPRGLELTVLGAADGPALLLRAPAGPAVLVGGSSSANDLSDALGRRLPPLERRLDALVITRASAAALSGLPVTVERFPAGRAFWAARAPANLREAERLRASLRRSGAGETQLAAGDVLSLGRGWRLSVLAVDGTKAALLIEGEGLRALVPGGLPLEALGEVGRVHLLVLGAEDIKEGTAGWEALGAQLTAAPGGPGGLPAGWLDLSGGGWLQLRVAGERMWLEQGQ